MNTTITIWNPELDLHNPDNLTPQQVGPAHRLLLKSELAAAKDKSLPCSMWDNDGHLGVGSWINGLLCQCVDFRTYRVDLTLPLIVAALAFPPLPPGEQWHNQVGEGYRLILKSEIVHRDELVQEIEMWDGGEWRSHFAGSSETRTYRVPLASWPMPKPKRLVPLEMADVPPGMYFVTHDPTTGWQMICEVSSDWFTVVYGIKPHRISWHAAAEHYKWTTTPQDESSWRPMTKEQP